MNIVVMIVFSLFLALGLCTESHALSCTIPVAFRGAWFSWEDGRNTWTELDPTTMTNRGLCWDIRNDHYEKYTMVFYKQETHRFKCIKFFLRNLNVLEKMESPYVSISGRNEATVERVSQSLDPNQQRVTHFSENYVPVNCRSSLEGIWNFSYQNKSKFSGECRNADGQIRSCQKAGSQFLKTNQKFTVTHKKREGMADPFDIVVEYSCLGDWFVGKNHYFAVVNTRESRKDEKYRCFLTNRDNDSSIGISVTPECSTLETIDKSPERLHLKPVKAEVVEPGCRLPQNFSGEWINTANIDSDVSINETHIVETHYLDGGRYKRTTYVCKEQRDTKVMMARLSVNGCQNDYICFDFVPPHHNLIRYRKGLAVIEDDFNTVCSEEQFQNKVIWKHDLFLKKDPVPIKCPVAGKFNFTQKGDVPFETKIVVGITLGPRPGISCKENISDFSVCDGQQKVIVVDEDHCLAVDYKGRPVYTYNEPDYKMECIGFWKENMTSYLITYDIYDPFSKYRCWVYQRTADSNRILMSQAIGSFCDLKQTVYSWNYTEGAALAIEMEEYEWKGDQCPTYFDDGTNPWSDPEVHTI